MPLGPSERRTRAKIGAHTVHAIHDGAEQTKRAREAFLASFPTRVDPDETLTPEERRRRADHLLRAHMARLSLMAAQARKARGNRSGRGSHEVSR
jgi:hypothetical protein